MDQYPQIGVTRSVWQPWKLPGSHLLSREPAVRRELADRSQLSAPQSATKVRGPPISVQWRTLPKSSLGLGLPTSLAEAS